MIKKNRGTLRSVLAVLLALVFLSAGTVLAAPEAADSSAPAEEPAEMTAAKPDVSARDASVVDIPAGTTAIANGQFRWNRDITMVRIPDSVKTIGEEAFYGCVNLNQIVIPDSVTTIGANAFAGSGISKADIGNGVTNIGDRAFFRCENLSALTLGSRVQVIGTQAFWGCTSLLQVNLPDSVTQIKGWTDTRDSYESDDKVAASPTYTDGNGGAFGNCTSLQRVTIGSGLTALEGHTFRGCTNLRQVTFGPNLRTIGPLAFRNTPSLEKADLPDSLTEIGTKAFKKSGVAEVATGSGLTKIGEYAFQDCRNLAEVQFGKNVRVLGAGAFSGCVSLEEALLPESVTILEGNGSQNGGVFSDCTSLSKVTTGDALVSIGSYAFYNCTALKTAVIGPHAQSAGASAFQNCSSLTELIIPDSVQSLGSNLAMASGISKVSIGSGVSSIPENAFQDCKSLTDLTIGKNVTNIEAGAFAGCQSLTEAVIPDRVDGIGAAEKTGAFADCISLETVTLGLRSYPAPNTFSGCWALRTIRYPGTQAQWDALGFPLPAGATLELFTPQPSASAEPTKDPGTEPEPSAVPSSSTAPSSPPSPSTDPSPGTSLPASAVQLSGCEFVYAGAQVPLDITLNDNRISSLTGNLVCTGFRETTLPVKAERTATGWDGTHFTLSVTAPAGQYVSCRLTDLQAAVNGQTVSLTDRYYDSIPVRTYNRPADYLRVTGPSAVRTGETISITVAGSGVEGIRGNVQTQGLEILSYSSSLSSSTAAIMLPLFGSPAVIYSCRVTAGPGQAISFRLYDVSLTPGDDMVLSAPDVRWSASVLSGPQPEPAPGFAAVSGYQGGWLNGRLYYVRTSGSRTMFYLRRQNGAMNRVAAPYVTDRDGNRYYPLISGCAVLFPRLDNGKLSAYCTFQNGMEIPMLAASADIPAADSLQSITVGGRTYFVRVSGSRMMFYLRRQDGSLNRVAAPYILGSDDIRYYPVSCGGTVLAPQLEGGWIASYSSGTGNTPVLTALS